MATILVPPLAVTETLLRYLSLVPHGRYGIHFWHGNHSNVPQTTRSSAILTPEPSSSTRSPLHIRNDRASRRSLSESRIPRDAHERVDVERDGGASRKRSSTSLTKEQGSIYPREGEGSNMTHEVCINTSPLGRLHTQHTSKTLVETTQRRGSVSI